ncbi:MAG: hypothetical protein ACREKN_05735 [Longimicrobiaceae bacterium]
MSAPALKLLVASALLLAGCATPPPNSYPAPPQDRFWTALQQLCGQAFAGELVQGSPTDTAFAGKTLVMHVRQCSEREVRIPFHAGENRSRTWILTRTASGLRLKHDHRHRDGSEDEITQYGGDTRDAGSSTRQEFYADPFTAELLPAARTNIWTVEVRPGESFGYALRREGTERRFRVRFDFNQAVAPPPAPWGYTD